MQGKPRLEESHEEQFAGEASLPQAEAVVKLYGLVWSGAVCVQGPESAGCSYSDDTIVCGIT